MGSPAARESARISAFESRASRKGESTRVLLRRAVPRAEVAGVVGVHAVGDRVETELLAQRAEHLEELRLAVEAAVRSIDAVGLALHLVRGEEAVRDAELAAHALRHRAVAGGIGGRVGRHREHSVAEDAVGGEGQVARVDPAGEGDDQAAGGPHSLLESDLFPLEFRGDGSHEPSLRGRPGAVKPSPADADSGARQAAIYAGADCKRAKRARSEPKASGGGGAGYAGAVPARREGGWPSFASVCLFGGRSVEHEVSVTSATCILKALDPTRYDVSLVAIDHQGRWHLGSRALPPDAAVSGAEVTPARRPGRTALSSRCRARATTPRARSSRST